MYLFVCSTVRLAESRLMAHMMIIIVVERRIHFVFSLLELRLYILDVRCELKRMYVIFWFRYMQRVANSNLLLW